MRRFVVAIGPHLCHLLPYLQVDMLTQISNPAAITPTASFAKDLNLDSLDTVEVVVAIEEEFGIEIPDKEADEIKSVNQAVEYILAQPDAK